MTTRLQQIAAHGVDAARYPFASFCFGRGWRGHKTDGAARRAASRDARAVARETGGGEPQHMVVRTADGVTI